MGFIDRLRNYDILNEVIKHQDSLDARTKNNKKTVLHCLSEASKNVEITSRVYRKMVLLLENGANPNIVDLKGNTPIFNASFSNGQLSIIKLLLQYGADINHRNSMGDTVLFWADGDGIVEHLVEKGCDTGVNNSIGMNALKTARFSGTHHSKVCLLEKYMA
ncbi:MAG TPA: ankyrin repeat domain-containing protein [Gammaproteobacteria bacterium]|nr:ankyrin repeat domain-containing protein [Gammaproteobacteria bacterium]